MRRWLPVLTTMLVALAALLLAPVPAGAAPAEQATVRMPFDGQWANTFGTAPWEHHRGSNDWAMDLFAVDKAVRLNVDDATGVLDLEVTDVVLDATCGGTAGSYVRVQVTVDQTVVGSVLFHHLVGVPVAEGDHVQPGQRLGRTVASPGALSGSCWHVSTPMGIHTHMAVDNAVGNSCYVNHQIGQTLNQTTAVGLLGHDQNGASVGSGARSDCDAEPAPLCHGLPATLVGTDGHDVLNGTSGPDVIVGLGGRDTINGFAGDDVICSGSGSDWVDAGTGDDYVNAGQTDDTVLGGDGDDWLIGGLQDDFIDGGDGADRVVGRAGDDELRGGPGADKMLGYDGADVVFGQGGRDKMFGGDGDDQLRGGADADSLSGKLGHDRCLGGAGTDKTHHSCEIVAQTP